MQSEKTKLIAEGSNLAERPFDAASLGNRECGNCACYFQMANMENASLIQGFCRRQPPDLQEIRVMKPRRDAKGNLVVGKDTQPIMEPSKEVGYLFKPATPQGICFDGWRAVGTLPGEQPASTLLRSFAPHLEPLLERCPAEWRPLLKALIGNGSPPQGTN